MSMVQELSKCQHIRQRRLKTVSQELYWPAHDRICAKLMPPANKRQCWRI